MNKKPLYDEKLLDICLILTNQNSDNDSIIRPRYSLDPPSLTLEKLFQDLHILNPIPFILHILIVLSNPTFFVVSNVIALII